ncbi:elongation factor P [Altererythrobacter xixiisoli]|uniref:Elongation factor P n=1 Tax=Croceibacterium xixiisoli TaxID=1476466 RepID=A0A6I4TZL7_9SPHN|nr:elongation factor P [Croceibacterium xixiisoli]MXO99803.1 elongation factor P [Croceibacterium xixiisoli]
MALISPAVAVAQNRGPIDTLPRGQYVCELPGNAGGRVGVVQPDDSFAIENASRYSSKKGAGTYLRRGDRLTFTSGARSGETYAIISDGFLRRMEGNQPGRLRCVREGSEQG